MNGVGMRGDRSVLFPLILFRGSGFIPGCIEGIFTGSGAPSDGAYRGDNTAERLGGAIVSGTIVQIVLFD